MQRVKTTMDGMDRCHECAENHFSNFSEINRDNVTKYIGQELKFKNISEGEICG